MKVDEQNIEMVNKELNDEANIYMLTLIEQEERMKRIEYLRGLLGHLTKNRNIKK